jgi:stalled ribosome rescue protein Dom34
MEILMNVKAGLWIDHRRALIVMTFEGGEKELEILSHVESQPGREEGVRSNAKFEAQKVQADDSHERAYQGQLNQYFAEVIKVIRDAESILIIGPGEAKEDLRKHLERARLGDRVSGLEVADKMTVPQIAAKVREHFHLVQAH